MCFFPEVVRNSGSKSLLAAVRVRHSAHHFLVSSRYREVGKLTVCVCACMHDCVTLCLCVVQTPHGQLN